LQSRLYQIYLTKLADETLLILKCPPTSDVRLLRHEKNTLRAETQTLKILRQHTQLPVPQVVECKSNAGQCGLPFLIVTHLPGRKLSELSSELTVTERTTIDRALGTYTRSLTSLSATQFGMAHRVFDGRGHKSWKEAFLTLLEAALRDAEDMLVTIPYDNIRYYITKHSHVLDEVVKPTLVALDVCSPANVLIDEATKRVTGLVGFSNVLWGDALMCGGLANGSDAFFEGFGECPARTAGIRIRMLMYVLSPMSICSNADMSKLHNLP
jgi:aminoglycoside phosphotransferase (APT) family kinase protein